MNDFSEYKFRASQAFKLNTGTIGLTESKKAKLSTLLKRRAGFEEGLSDENGKPYKKLTANMELELDDLLEEQKNPQLPKTMIAELRKIHRAEKYNRNFVFTNKYVQKGLAQEEEAITTYQKWIKEVKGINRLFSKNTERHFGKYFQGEPDIKPFELDEETYCGVDTKCSWSLDTFPFDGDPLIDQYECQNQVYMALTNSQMWVTAYVLVNATELLVQREKEKWAYALATDGMLPNDMPEHPNYDEFISKCKDVEKMLIFDFDRFVNNNPAHLLEYTRKEWMEEGNDIPLEDRVIEKVSYKDDSFIAKLEHRAKLGREYLNSL